jgi:hypothetical protein
MERSRRADDGQGHVPEYLLGEEAFRELVAHERACSDRSGAPFAVLAFDVGPRARQGDELVAAIVARVRVTDALGWLEDGRLGVLLRYATVEDALRVADEVRARAGAEPGIATCTVHGYPPFERGVARAPESLPPLARGLPHALGQSRTT